MGAPLPREVVRGAMLLRCNALARGNSGIRLSTLETLLAMLNRGVHPVIPEKGSLGASGILRRWRISCWSCWARARRNTRE